MAVSGTEKTVVFFSLSKPKIEMQGGWKGYVPTQINQHSLKERPQIITVKGRGVGGGGDKVLTLKLI